MGQRTNEFLSELGRRRGTLAWAWPAKELKGADSDHLAGGAAGKQTRPKQEGTGHHEDGSSQGWPRSFTSSR